MAGSLRQSPGAATGAGFVATDGDGGLESAEGRGVGARDAVSGRVVCLAGVISQK
jgi:hypothetical protein